MSGFLDLLNGLANTQFGQGDGIQAVVNNVGSLAKLKRLNPGDNAQDYQNMAQSSPYQQPVPISSAQQQPDALQNQPQQDMGNGLLAFILSHMTQGQKR
jgi:hypothetical protein